MSKGGGTYCKKFFYYSVEVRPVFGLENGPLRHLLSTLFQRFISLKLFFAYVSRTDRASGLSGAGSGIDHCLPDMPLRTDPPNLFLAPDRYLVRCQRPVHRRVPPRCHSRLKGSQIIESGQHLSVGAIGTAGQPLCAGVDRRPPFMSKRALPPDPLIVISRHFLRKNTPVFGRMPLPHQKRILACQIVHALNHLLPAADRTPGSVHPVFYFRLPFMSVPTAPPHTL